MSATDLETVAWDLGPLLNGGAADPEATVTKMLEEAQRRADAFAAAPRRQASPELDGRRPRRRDARARPTPGPRSAAPAPTRCCASPPTPPTRPRGALLQQVQERATGDRDRAAVLRARVGGARRRRAPSELLAAEGLDFARHHLRTARRYRPHLLTEPEEKILAEKAVTGRSAWARLFGELTSAITVAARRTSAEPVARDRARRGCSSPTARLRRTPPRRVTAALAAGPAHARLHLQHAARTTRPSTTACATTRTGSPSRNLSNEATDESVQALVEAVERALRLPQRWYRLKAQLLGVDQLADYDRMAVGRRRTTSASAGRGDASWCSTPTAPSRDELGDARAALLRRALDRRAGAPGQARRRVLRLHRAVGAPVRAAELDVQAPRRADARPRARPRRARRARRQRRASSTRRRR